MELDVEVSTIVLLNFGSSLVTCYYKTHYMDRVKIFIGSSTEGLDVAYAIQQNLEHNAEVTIWTQGIFQLSMPIITSLLNQLDVFDFAIFIFSPDDIIKLRGAEFTSIRDNVIFETGLFAGKLGIERVYFVKPRGQQQNIHLPTDLLGVIAGEYEVRSDNNLCAATGVFSNQVRQRIQQLGKFNHTKVGKINPIENYENDLAILFTYMEDKGWTTMSFEKIQSNVHPKLTEEYLMKLMDIYPKAIRRSKLSEGVYGIKWLSKKE